MAGLSWEMQPVAMMPAPRHRSYLLIGYCFGGSKCGNSQTLELVNYDHRLSGPRAKTSRMRATKKQATEL